MFFFVFFRNRDQDEIVLYEKVQKILNDRVNNLCVQIDYHQSLVNAKKRKLEIEQQEKKTARRRLHYLKVLHQLRY